MSRESRPPARGSPFASPCPGEAIVESGLEGMAHAVRAHPRTRAGFTSDRHRCCAMQHFATCNGTALQFSSLPLCGAFLVALQRLLHGLCYAGSHPLLHGQQHSYSSCLFRLAFPSSFLGLCCSFKSKSSLSSWQWSCLCNAARELRCLRRRRRQIHHSRPCPRPHPLPGSRQFPCSTPWPPAQLVKCVIIRSPAGMRGGGGQDECIGSGRCPWRLV